MIHTWHTLYFLTDDDASVTNSLTVTSDSIIQSSARLIVSLSMFGDWSVTSFLSTVTELSYLCLYPSMCMCKIWHCFLVCCTFHRLPILPFGVYMRLTIPPSKNKLMQTHVYKINNVTHLLLEEVTINTRAYIEPLVTVKGGARHNVKFQNRQNNFQFVETVS